MSPTRSRCARMVGVGRPRIAAAEFVHALASARPRAGYRQGFECEAPPCGRGPLRCSVPRPRRQLTTRSAGAAFRQSRRSQSTRRAARAGHGPCASRHRFRSPGGDPTAAWPALVVCAKNNAPRGVSRHRANHRGARPRMAGKRILEVKGEPGRQTGRRTWKDSLPRRPRLAPMHRRRRSAMRRVPWYPAGSPAQMGVRPASRPSRSRR
jgi:hypothetical protein